MTREEAARILDPETSMETLAEIEYYAGFSGREAVKKAMHDARVMGAEALSQPPADVPDTNVGEWIPCSERLPEDSNTYEVTVYFDGLLFATNSYYSTLDLKWHTYGGYVTAWRERLSEPYKGV